MLVVFVIAFIHCSGESCVISYPRPGQAYTSYDDCKARLPEAPTRAAFDGASFEGSEIACLEVPARNSVEEWIAVEPTNLRDAPSVGARVIETVKRGTTFRVVAQERKWLSVQTEDGRFGFLWSDRAKQLR